MQFQILCRNLVLLRGLQACGGINSWSGCNRHCFLFLLLLLLNSFLNLFYLKMLFFFNFIIKLNSLSLIKFYIRFFNNKMILRGFIYLLFPQIFKSLVSILNRSIHLILKLLYALFYVLQLIYLQYFFINKLWFLGLIIMSRKY